jgi:hypothetical protein
VEHIEDAVQKCCKEIAELKLGDISDQQKTELKKRKLISEV